MTDKQQQEKYYIPVIASVFLTAGLLTIARMKTSIDILLADRFLPGSGWIEIIVLSCYAGWITNKMHIPKQAVVWRYRIWILFSFVFFTQLLLGICGFEKFLMTGKLHLPIPALIIGAPIYRGGGIFMLILLSVTLLLVGPAWCSYLCYIGAWDNIAGNRKKRPQGTVPYRQTMRIIILCLVIVVVFLLRHFQVPGWIAAIIAALFGIAGVGVMVWWSRKKGIMVHCISYCPIGVITTFLGKLSPFRIRIAEACRACDACSRVCRYDALRPEDIQRRKPAITCTLCGDCIKSCRDRSINYRFLWLPPDKARSLFIVTIISLHSVFLAVARI